MGSATKLSINRYLTICGEIEKTVALIYDYWSGIPGFDRDLKKLWVEMRDEEMDHFAQVELLRRLARGNEIGRRTLDDDNIKELAEFAKTCLDQVKKGWRSDREALLLAIHLENIFMKFHATQAFVCDQSGMAKMFNNLAANDHAHGERLRQIYLQRFCTEPPQYAQVS